MSLKEELLPSPTSCNVFSLLINPFPWKRRVCALLELSAEAGVHAMIAWLAPNTRDTESGYKNRALTR